MVNNFIPFANGAAANVDTQAEWVAAATGGYVENGFVAGTASAKAANKALRQSSVGVAALTTFIANELGQDVLDSGGSAAVTALAAQIASAIKAAMQPGAGNYAADTGTANAMVATLSPAPTALTVGMTVRVKKAATANTGATTLNVNALGAQPVVDEEGNALLAGQLAASSILAYTWDGTSWRVEKPKADTLRAAGSSGQVQFNNDAVGASANLHWDNANGRLGVGTATPAHPLDVTGVIRGRSSIAAKGAGTYGSVSLVPGDGLNAGYVAWWDPAAEGSPGTRRGYMGWHTSNITLALENGSKFCVNDGQLHVRNSVLPCAIFEHPSSWASFALKGGANQACVFHYGDPTDGTHELRIGRYAGDMTTWQANVVKFDMDAPDNSISLNGSGNTGFGTPYPSGRVHAYGNVWPSVIAENPSGNASVALKGNYGQTCVLHYGDSGGGNDLRFARCAADYAWQANPVKFDMDAPDGSLIVYGNGNVGCGGTVAASAFYGVGAVPVGGGGLWFCEWLPTGFLECNGAWLSRTTYAGLFAVIGTQFGAGDGWSSFALPDLRGVFPRGWDHGRGVDPDRASRSARGDGTTGDHVGTWQGHELYWHTHGLRSLRNNGQSIPVNGGGQDGYGDTSVNYTGGNETRPVNMNVMMIIRAY